MIVNKLKKLPSDWEDKVITTTFTNTLGDEVEVEINAYDAYLKLKKALDQDQDISAVSFGY